MRLRAVALMIFIATAPRALAESIPDAEALTIVRKHCVMCHAPKPTHESFEAALKNIALYTVVDPKKHASIIYAQIVQTKAMPLGNGTGMRDDARAALGRWLMGSL